MNLIELKREIVRRGIILYQNPGYDVVQYKCKRYVPIKVHEAIQDWSGALADALLQVPPPLLVRRETPEPPSPIVKKGVVRENTTPRPPVETNTEKPTE